MEAREQGAQGQEGGAGGQGRGSKSSEAKARLRGGEGGGGGKGGKGRGSKVALITTAITTARQQGVGQAPRGAKERGGAWGGGGGRGGGGNGKGREGHALEPFTPSLQQLRQQGSRGLGRHQRGPRSAGGVGTKAGRGGGGGARWGGDGKGWEGQKQPLKHSNTDSKAGCQRLGRSDEEARACTGALKTLLLTARQQGVGQAPRRGQGDGGSREGGEEEAGMH